MIPICKCDHYSYYTHEYMDSIQKYNWYILIKTFNSSFHMLAQNLQCAGYEKYENRINTFKANLDFS